MEILQQQLHLPASEARTEELCGKVGYLVRLIEDHRIGTRQQVAVALLLEREIREQQMVIDDNQVRLARGASRGEHMAPGELGAARPLAAVARRGDARPQRMAVGEFGHLCQVAAARCVGPFANPREQAARRGPVEREFGLGAQQTLSTQVVVATLQQRDARDASQHAREQRHIAREQLVLQRARARGNDHLAAGEQRGNQVGERLARTRAGFHEQTSAALEGRGDPRGHPSL